MGNLGNATAKQSSVVSFDARELWFFILIRSHFSRDSTRLIFEFLAQFFELDKKGEKATFFREILDVFKLLKNSIEIRGVESLEKLILKRMEKPELSSIKTDDAGLF